MLFRSLLYVIIMNTKFHQGGREVLGHSRQQVVGEVEFLHPSKRHEGPWMDPGDLVIYQHQSLDKGMASGHLVE